MNRRKLKRVLCLANRAQEACARAADELAADLRRAGYQVSEGVEAFPESKAEVLLVLGGDGFLMESLRLVGYPPVPVFGANFGSVGYLMNTKESLSDLADLIGRWDFETEDHVLLKAKVVLEHGSQVEMLAFNDFVVERMTRQSLRLRVSLDGVFFNNYAGDGFILATTAGSTAYNLAAGGPVVHPSLQLMIVTPLYPHRASPFHSMQFSLLIPLESRLMIVADDLPKRGMRVVGDGLAVDHARSVEIFDSSKKVTLLRPRAHSFVKTLVRKFIDSSTEVSPQFVEKFRMDGCGQEPASRE